MEFNKDGRIEKYYNLDDILKLDLSSEARETIKKCFGKKVYFEKNDSCKMGKLCGLEMNYQLAMVYYIIEDANGKKIFVPIHQSITPL